MPKKRHHGGDDVVLAKSFIIAHEGATLSWFFWLPPGSIFSWEQLRVKLIEDFQGFTKSFLTSGDVFNGKQGDKEPLANYFKRFIQLWAQTSNAPDSVPVDACISCLGLGPCASEFTKNKLRTFMSSMQKWRSFVGTSRIIIAKSMNKAWCEKQITTIKGPNLFRIKKLQFPTKLRKPCVRHRRSTFVGIGNPPNPEQQKPPYPQSQPSRGGRNTRGRGRVRGRGPQQNNQLLTWYCQFHGKGSDHDTSRCPKTQKQSKEWNKKKKPSGWSV